MQAVTQKRSKESKKGTEAWLGEMLACVAQEDPYRALEDALTCFDVLRSDEKLNPRRRFDAIGKLDLAASSHLRRLTLEYVEGALRTVPARETYTRYTVLAYLRHLADSYEECVLYATSPDERSPTLLKSVPVMMTRCLRAIGGQMKWAKFFYGASDGALWQRLGALYMRAEHEGFARHECIIYSDPIVWTTVEQEYLAVLMWIALGADSLTPRQIELAQRLNHYFASSFQMYPQPAEGLRYCVDLATANPPRRVTDLDTNPAPTMRYFGPGGAREKAKRLVEVLVGRHAIPEELSQGENLDKLVVVKALHHAHRQWAASPPSRSERRDEAYGRLFVVHGFDALAQACSGGGKVLAQPVESWLVKNMSESGFGAEFPDSDEDWPHVGCLLGVRLDSAVSWGVGFIRRLLVNASGMRYVGVQMLGKSASVVTLKPAQSSNAQRLEEEAAFYVPGT
ncbi:MAG: hypothetical protein ACKVQA_18920, partial [Burkholderiales bacterium]